LPRRTNSRSGKWPGALRKKRAWKRWLCDGGGFVPYKKRQGKIALTFFVWSLLLRTAHGAFGLLDEALPDFKRVRLLIFVSGNTIVKGDLQGQNMRGINRKYEASICFSITYTIGFIDVYLLYEYNKTTLIFCIPL
jgi:hypothetical protein